MPRSSRFKPSDPEAIRLRNAAARSAELLRGAEARAGERDRGKDPANWGVANDTVRLPTGENVDAVPGTRNRVVHAKRANPFDTLYAAGALRPGQHQAAMRLFKDWCESMGIRTEEPLPILELIQHQSSAELIPQKQIDAGRRYDRVLSYVGRADADLLKVLMSPKVMCGTVLIWRAEVERLAAERERHAQGAVVRRACENLRLAYERFDAVDAPLEVEERRRRAELDWVAIAREA